MEDNSAKVNQCEVVEWPWWLHFYLSCWPRISPQFGGLITVKMKLFADGWKWHKKKAFDSTTFSLYCLPSHLESPLRRKLSTMTKFTQKLFSTYKTLPWVLPHWWVVQSVLARAHICITPPCYRGSPKDQCWGPSSSPHIPHPCTKSSTHMASLITAMQMIPSSICISHLMPPPSDISIKTDPLLLVPIKLARNVFPWPLHSTGEHHLAVPTPRTMVKWVSKMNPDYACFWSCRMPRNTDGEYSSEETVQLTNYLK